MYTVVDGQVRYAAKLPLFSNGRENHLDTAAEAHDFVGLRSRCRSPCLLPEETREAGEIILESLVLVPALSLITGLWTRLSESPLPVTKAL